MGDGPLSKKELDQTTAAWRKDLAERGYSVDASKQPVAKGLPAVGLSARDKGLLQGVAESIAPYLERIEQLEQRVEELERRPELKYLGVFRDDGRKYSEGSAVTHSGGVWVALRATTEKPNHSADWQLAVKSGEHSTPTPRSDAATVNTRVNGHYSQPRTR